jgi:CheY-like chemotaxis protein
MEQRVDARIVRQALENLYNNVKLAESELASFILHEKPAKGVVERAQMLRNLLIDAIESMRPLRLGAGTQSQEREYEVISLRYISGLSIPEISEQLAVGDRQIYRDLRRAEDQLAAIVQAQIEQTGEGQPAATSTGNPLHQELEALALESVQIDLTACLHHVLETVKPLALRRQVQIDLHVAPEVGRMFGAPGVITQLLVQLASAAIQLSDPGAGLPIRLVLSGKRVHLSLVVSQEEAHLHSPLLESAQQMSSSLGFTCQVENQPRASEGQQLQIELALPVATEATVLVVEDNAGAQELYQRYLQGTHWKVITISNPLAGEHMIATLQPAVVILDLLMPTLDGWTILQALQMNPATQHIPVIISSAVSDPELAQSLGALASLKKPVSRLALLAALQHAEKWRTSGERDAGRPQSG